MSGPRSEAGAPVPVDAASRSIDGSESVGVRRAAAYAHALHDADRAWLLDALDPAERRTLAPLLAELDALVGRAPRATPGPAAPATAPIDSASASATASAPPLACAVGRDLATRPLRDLAARFAHEPDDVVGLVLACAPDDATRRRALRAIEPARRAAIAGRSLAVDTGSARARAVCAAWTSAPWTDTPAEPLLPRAGRAVDRAVAGAAGHATASLRTLAAALRGAWLALRATLEASLRAVAALHPRAFRPRGAAGRLRAWRRKAGQTGVRR